MVNRWGCVRDLLYKSAYWRLYIYISHENIYIICIPKCCFQARDYQKACNVYHSWKKVGIDKSNPASKENFVYSANVIFGLPSLLNFFKIWDLHMDDTVIMHFHNIVEIGTAKSLGKGRFYNCSPKHKFIHAKNIIITQKVAGIYPCQAKIL